MSEHSDHPLDTAMTGVSLNEFLFSQALPETVLAMRLFMDHEPSKNTTGSITIPLSDGSYIKRWVESDGSRHEVIFVPVSGLVRPPRHGQPRTPPKPPRSGFLRAMTNFRKSIAPVSDANAVQVPAQQDGQQYADQQL
jgi:hypothetical protein